MSIAAELRSVARIGIDSSAFIDHAEGGDGAAALSEIFRRLSTRALVGVASVTVIPEVLVGALRSGDREVEKGYRALLALCEVVPVTEEIAEEALTLRAHYGLKTPDAFHIATALHARCDAVLTNDDADFSRVRNSLRLPHAPERTLRILVARKV